MGLQSLLFVLVAFIFIGHIQFTVGFRRPRVTLAPGVTAATPVLGWDFDKNYKDKDADKKYDKEYKKNNDGYPSGNSYEEDDGGYYNNDDDDNDDKYPEDRSKRTRKSPDSMGNMNVYFREPSYDGKRRKPKRIRFSAARYERERFPSFGPLLSFLPWAPIFADPLTKQTIIYSPTGGIYIIPPVINFYGDLFSIAELIASGYASLVSTGAPPPPAIDVAPLVRPGPVVGPGAPVINPATGGFRGAVRTKFRSFPRPDYPKTFQEFSSFNQQQDQFQPRNQYPQRDQYQQPRNNY